MSALLVLSLTTIGLTQPVPQPILEPLASGSRRRLVPGSSLLGELGEFAVPPPPDGWFDSRAVGACAVQRLSQERWVMWYAGRATNFPRDVVPIATGAIGLAVSKDGLMWERACGPGSTGECLAPVDGDFDAFDASHIGVGDVARMGNELWMVYFGGGNAFKDLGGGRAMRGVNMGLGVAVSTDGGVHWRRRNEPLLMPTDGAQAFVGWPALHGSHVYYHAYARGLQNPTDLYES